MFSQHEFPTQVAIARQELAAHSIAILNTFSHTEGNNPHAKWEKILTRLKIMQPQVVYDAAKISTHRMILGAIAGHQGRRIFGVAGAICT